MKNNIFLLSLLFIQATSAFAAPKHVSIIRHAEKPKDDDKNYLSPEGERRAVALVNYMKKSPDMNKMGMPKFIFAAAPKKEGSSIRSIQTALPLSKHLNVKINTDYTSDDYNLLVKELLANPKYNNQTVFIVWAHKRIAKIVKGLGAKDAPDEWEDDEYDRTWVIHYQKKQYDSFENLKQNIDVN